MTFTELREAITNHNLDSIKIIKVVEEDASYDIAVVTTLANTKYKIAVANLDHFLDTIHKIQNQGRRKEGLNQDGLFREEKGDQQIDNYDVQTIPIKVSYRKANRIYI